MNNKDKEVILKYLKSQILMMIATSDKKGNIWPATVYYLEDEGLNLYFMSSPKALHSINISKNTSVAVAIADSRQKPSGGKIGIQIFGKCTRVMSPKRIIEILIKWNKKFSDKPAPPYKDLIKSGSPFYMVKPVKIKMFNKKQYPVEKDGEFLV